MSPRFAASVAVNWLTLSIVSATFWLSTAASRLSVFSPRPGSRAVKAATSVDTAPSVVSVASMLSRCAWMVAATSAAASTVARTCSGSTAAAMASILSIEPETLAGSIAASRLSVFSPMPGSFAVKAATSFDTVPSRASVASMLSRLA